jgi:acyl-CoA synthetase (AMP-forming)/AMP-acid ligase II
MSVATTAPVNVARHLEDMARRSPDKDAIVLSRRTRTGLVYETLSFRALEAEASRIAHGLVRVGITRGVRTVLLVPPSREFFALVFALFKVGAVTVLIDPGVGKKNLLQCLEKVEPEAFIAISKAQAARVLLRALPSVRIPVTVGRRWFWRGPKLSQLRDDRGPFPTVDSRPDETAAILFTTGSTGVPKGAVYTHGVFDAQVQALRAIYGFAADEIDLPTFPLFALFDPALGMTAVIPDMDFTRPAHVARANIIDAINERGVTSMFGSPALLDRVAGPEKLSTLRRVISAGAPARPAVLERFQAMLPAGAEISTPYGATEALPVATIGSREILSETRRETERGQGTCVGRPAPDIAVKIIKISDAPIAAWSQDLLAAPGEVGEICVQGPVVTRSYFARPDQTSLAKIADGERFWHRMGDLGRFDDQGRLWFFGRKSHRVGDLYTEACEAIFNTHPSVRRSALVGVAGRPVIVIERSGPVSVEELRALARSSPVTERIETFLSYPGSFPVDVRHNAKIFREQLAPWAASQLR